MLKEHSGGIPSKIEVYIRIQINRMYKTNLFQYQERADLQQELVLFYIEHFYRQEDVPDELLFIALRRQANHLIRSRLRSIQSGVFFNESLNSMFDEKGLEATSDFCLEDLEKQIDLNKALSKLNTRERKLLTELLKGEPITEVTKKLKISHGAIYKIIKKISELKQ